MRFDNLLEGQMKTATTGILRVPDMHAFAMLRQACPLPATCTFCSAADGSMRASDAWLKNSRMAKHSASSLRLNYVGWVRLL